MMELFAASQPGLLRMDYFFALALGALGIYLLLPKPKGKTSLLGSLAALGSLAWLGYLGFSPTGITIETGLFYLFGFFALVGAGLMVTQTNPARAAISFVLVVICVGGLMLLLAAPFLMAANMIVYAGAIVVTFLFVLMLASQRAPSDSDNRSREPALACFTGLALSASLILLLQRDQENANKGMGQWKGLGAPVAAVRLHQEENLRRDASGRPHSPADNTTFLGQTLYTSLLLPVELAGALLLVATVGAILIAQRRSGVEVMP